MSRKNQLDIKITPRSDSRYEDLRKPSSINRKSGSVLRGDNRDGIESQQTRSKSTKKESAPIIINKDEQFMYKAPSTIHETVVLTLRKEKDNLAQALQSQSM